MIAPGSSRPGISGTVGNSSAEKVGNTKSFSGAFNVDTSKRIKKTRSTYGGLQVPKSVSPTSRSYLPMHFGHGASNTARMGRKSTRSKCRHRINETVTARLPEVQ